MKLKTIGDPRKPLQELRGIVEQQLACALEELRRANGANVHGARKQLKKARAMLRLLRSALGEEIYEKENAALRDAARPISGLRDSEVLPTTFSKMLDRSDDGVAHPGLDSARGALLVYTRELAQAYAPVGN
jgi:CHAD domain-containing protein